MSEVRNKSDLVEQIITERNNLEATLATIGEEQMIQPGVVGSWTIKDLLAHITAWEQLMVGWLEITLLGETPKEFQSDQPWTDEDVDKLNEQIYQEHKDQPLDEVIAEFHSSYQQALEISKKASEEQLFDEDYYEWREGRPLWHMIGGNTFWHYSEHNREIQIWAGVEIND